CFLYLLDLHSFPTRRSSDLLYVPEYDQLVSICPFSSTSTPNQFSILCLTSNKEFFLNTSILFFHPITSKGSNEVLCRFPFFSLRSEEHTSELQSRENLVCRL